MFLVKPTVNVCYKKSLFSGLETLDFEEDTVYLVFRFTDSKGGILAREYNIGNENVSHVGLGILSDNKLIIYHTDTELSQRGDNLFIQTLDEFTDREDLKSLKIMKLKNINFDDLFIIKNNLKKSLEKPLYFDMEFLLGNNKFYCSEYVTDILGNTNIYYKHKKSLSGIAREFLKRDTLIYYPVDSYNTSLCDIIFEWQE